MLTWLFNGLLHSSHFSMDWSNPDIMIGWNDHLMMIVVWKKHIVDGDLMVT